MKNNTQHIIEKTSTWVKEFVIQLNLCPFANRPFQDDKIRFRVSNQNSLEELMIFFWKEIELMEKLGNEEISNSLIIIPNQLNDFYDYLDFLEAANILLEEQEKDTIFQLASFHPDYLFGDYPPDDVKHFTNRSPFPMVHILRIEEVSKAIETHPDTNAIPDNNRITLTQFFKNKK